MSNEWKTDQGAALFRLGQQARFALTVGGAPQELLDEGADKWWLVRRVEATKECIGKITYAAEEVLSSLKSQGYHILEQDSLRPESEWPRPSERKHRLDN